ncbi:MAG TPA: hypothetical protein VN641_16975 [Urbifossiella sp.]|nr:hypothetical protein [Urbifossiella sp.]
MLSRPTLDLFIVSWLVLFLELTCIRWFPSHIVFLTFFTNIVLLACFVGMSVGCLAARNSSRYLRQTPMWLLLGVLLGLVIEANRDRLLPLIAIGDRKNSDQVFFGAEAGDSLPFRVPVEFVAGAFFLLIGAVMVGPGQEMGRAFNRVTSRTRAYSANLLGSLAGIGSFAACSYLQLPPIVWFAASSLGIGFLLIRPDETNESDAGRERTAIIPLTLLACCVGLSSITSGFGIVHHRAVFWSPYYRIDFEVDNHLIETNLVGHQIIEPRNRVPIAPNANYALPYLLHRDLTGSDGRPVWKPFKKVLIIGAGSGNDVARALQWLGDDKDAWIDAVEIDPVIQRLGALHHPDAPYKDSRVHVHLNDGRNFLRSAQPETYDLVIFALVDSLVLQLGSGNMRLESYLFTEQALEDVRRALKPSGLCAIYNYFRHGWLAARINAELAQVFGVEPAVIVLTAEPKDNIKLADTDAAIAFTAFLAGSKEVIDPLRKKFQENGNSYWLPGDRPPHPTGTIGHFGLQKPGPLPPPPKEAASINPHVIPTDWRALRVAAVEPLGKLPLATDDWPFLYVREPGIPLVTWRGMVVMAVLSLVLWFLYRPRNPVGRAVPDFDDSLTTSTKMSGTATKMSGTARSTDAQLGLMLRSFFLGAGFMLVETKAVVQMALLFGSTWMVNTVVFAAILVMSLAGTLFVAKFTPKRLELFYMGLFAAAAVAIAVPLDTFLGMDRSVQIAASCALVFAPIAFAGVIFATTFARSRQPDRVFGANVAGALLGGIAENASVFLGFQYLLCVAVGFYLLSAAFGNRTLFANPERHGV